MIIKFYSNSSPKNTINKSITFIKEYEIVLKGNTDIFKPTIRINTSDSLFNVNYAYIPYFNRYYFVEKMDLLTGGIISFKLNVDVIESFRNDILNSYGYVTKQKNNINNYYNDSYDSEIKKEVDFYESDVDLNFNTNYIYSYFTDGDFNVLPSVNIRLSDESGIKRLYISRVKANSSGFYSTSNKYISILKLDLQINADLINSENHFTNYLYTYDLGTFKVDEKYHNVYDYLNTICVFKIPFYGDINIDVDYVVNQTINITMQVNFITGESLLQIYSTFNNNYCYTESKVIATLLPIVNIPLQEYNSNFTFVNRLYDDVTLEITRNIPYTSENITGKKTFEYIKLIEITGYCEVSEIELISTATNEESEEISSILKNGIFINH